LALRPEGTAGIVRSYIENRFDVSFPSGKFFYGGEMFRYERPQAGRYRQFNQMGAEYFGNSSPAADAQIIILAADILSAVGIKELTVHINSLGCPKCRPLFREALVKYFSSVKDLCADCNVRLDKNPLRLLDCKIDAPKFTEVPQMTDYLCSDCKDNFNTVENLLKSAGQNFIVDPKLVRGLDYYTRTVFEIRSNALGAQSALAGGGRYDGLVKELGGQDTPAVGFAFGTERVMIAAREAGFFNTLPKPEKIFIAIADQELFEPAFAFAMNLAKNKKNISIEGPVNNKNLGSQLKLADKLNSDKAIIFAKTEYDNGKVLVKNMKDKTQQEVLISEV
ncbi:MAG: histidine--tRNA ligase, partial [Endomicrobia bacterium]|nr:histidine--tRNA ligase [Endomicrobiia bacterium]